MEGARPTLRCLQDDLQLPLPSLDEPLDRVQHPLLGKASAQFAAPDTPHERVRTLDDQVFFKVKIQRWRGAVWAEHVTPWLVAAGRRESGSPDDFYAALAATARTARARYNAGHQAALPTDTYSAYLLPNQDDRLRYRLEAGLRFIRTLEALIPDLVRASLHDGHEHTADLETFVLGVQVRADAGHETYVAIRITGSVPENITQIILDIVPGCEHGGWFPETALPDRGLQPNEQAWSNIMDTAAAAKLLDLADG
ncbi:hypothetical protein [Plantactinospora endophytica]|uniref:Uncharacterized protein n=1 Tax=Plantactinospora endophytica TaxID=673535 RepID=A0ABQ4E429_9ACTN|nr:hypothetical protein [Plantactinospora endophytica]GIG89451.1 hypothetical protein Pen02_43870 [Plantactinospora endophytica]